MPSAPGPCSIPYNVYKNAFCTWPLQYTLQCIQKCLLHLALAVYPTMYTKMPSAPGPCSIPYNVYKNAFCTWPLQYTLQCIQKCPKTPLETVENDGIVLLLKPF